MAEPVKLICPCCGATVDGRVDPAVLGGSLPLSGQQRRIYDALANSFGRWVSGAALVEAIYWDDPTGGPDDTTNVIKVQTTFLRAAVAPFGLVIDVDRQPGGARRRLTWGNQVGSAVVKPTPRARMSRLQRVIFDELESATPGWVSTDQLVAALLAAGSRHNPGNARYLVSALLNRIRHLAGPYGYRIEFRHGDGRRLLRPGEHA